MSENEYSFFQKFFEGDSPLTLGILLYVVYLLHQSDQKQAKAIAWLRKTILGLQVRIDNLEQFNNRVHPDEWRQPPNLPHLPVDDDLNFIDIDDD